jgi:dipeptidyl aminopeptidase/acylaminoacyl peptidase
VVSRSPDDVPAFVAESVAGGGDRTEVTAVDGAVCWLEHSFDAGRSHVVRATRGDVPRAMTPAGVDVGTLAWEYGGGSYAVVGRGLVYADRDDQRLYRLDPGGSPVALTPAPELPRGDRFADGCVAPGGRWAAYVHEAHRPGEPVRHALAAVDLAEPRPPRTLVAGGDFYASPQISPDGRRLAWITWSKPNMPWDGTELWIADIGRDLSVAGERRIAGGSTESVLQPRWSGEGALHWVSDRSGWWNLYRLEGDTPHPLCPQSAEFAVPPWHHGRRSYDFLADGTIAALRVRDGIHELVRLHPGSARVERLTTEFTAVTEGHLSCHGDTIAFAGATPTAGAAVITLDARSGRATTVTSDGTHHPADVISVGEPVEIPGPDGEPTYGFWYAPRPAVDPGRRPGLILQLHGGPTDAASLAFNAELQLWTSRGYAVLDLNYSGSTGFGSAYRHRLDGAWGDRDLADCIAAVDHLAGAGMVDRERVFARGASAGGYLALRCVSATAAFRGAMARCAITDLAGWRADAHDFESRYTDMLVGLPVEAERYRSRSPVDTVDAQSAPALLVHGLADLVVPPAHSVRMADAYRNAGRPCRLELLADEPHGLRRADSRRRWLTAGLDFVVVTDRLLANDN